jgi:hypothetical protein
VLTAVSMLAISPLARLAAATALLSACAAEPTDNTICEAGKCDGLPFLDQIRGREDPVAQWLRQLAEAGVIDDNGIYRSDRAGGVAPTNEPLFYGKMLAGLATVQGCSPNSLINYAISDDLISGDPDSVFPRLVSTVCSDTNDLVTNAYVATLGNPDENDDLALDELEMFAWDPAAQKYFFYATKGTDDELEIEVEPARCLKCHLTPRDVDPVGMPRLPIMNELTKPWTHWNAGTGGVSESFLVPVELEGKPKWERFGATSGAASRFEKVIRDANSLRVTPTRAKQLFRPAKLDEAMGLIRPLFCDEQLNYVTELATGEVPTDAVIAGGIKGAFRGIQAAWPWGWFNNDTLQLPPAAEDQRLFMLPVRGVADITFEPQLQAVLSPQHILAVRALDWKRPAFSEFRCNLWKTAMIELAANPPALTGRNRDAIKVVYEEIMKLGGMSIREIGNGRFVALEDAEASAGALRDAVAAGTVPTSCDRGFCEVDAMGFGSLLDGYVTSLGSRRAELLAERDRRVCMVEETVEPAGAHAQHGPGNRIPNDPSFLRVPTGSTRGISTVPARCN